MYSVLMMQRRKDLWGPDGELFPQSAIMIVIFDTSYLAEEFDPDRFLDNRVKNYLVKNSFIFLPFNAGPRICLGQQVRCSISPQRIYGSHFRFVSP